MNVLLAHYRHVFDEQTLMKWTSPHFSPKEAGEELRTVVLPSLRNPVSQADLVFNRSHIICANEVFPESAVADPVADMEIWDEWRRGARAFPYPGKYSRLGITTQEGKTSSKTSVGMIGEVLAGLASQSYLGPWVLVRVINRWPDFIYYTRDGRYAFVESKAFGAFGKDPSNPEEIPAKILGGCLFEAAQQLNTDPFVKVWLCFTGISSIDPFYAAVLLLELDAPNRRRETAAERAVPQAVISGLAHRAIVHAASDMEDGPEEQDIENLHEPSQGADRESDGRLRKPWCSTPLSTLRKSFSSVPLPGTFLFQFARKSKRRFVARQAGPICPSLARQSVSSEPRGSLPKESWLGLGQWVHNGCT